MSAMSKLHVSHISSVVMDRYADLLPLKDVATAPEHQKTVVTKTRGLAAFALQSVVADVEPAVCGAHVTDGSDDNGIDALYVDLQEKKIYVVQSKWHEDGTGTIGLGDIRNTIAGLRDLTEERFDRFNDRFGPMVPQVEEALSDPQVTFTLIIALTGPSTFADKVQDVIEDAKREMNEISEMLTVRILGLAELHQIVREGGKSAKIDLEVTLEEWGSLNQPYDAYYGLIDGATVAGSYHQHGGRLFDDNLRKALGHTPVNASLLDTLTGEPEHFWYYNNGITALCDSVNKLPRGGASRLSGDFVVKGLSIVNGAQTVSSLSTRARVEDNGLEAVRVWVRLISLEGCPPGFATEVTRATNTQNVVESRDFLSLDPTQQRLQDDIRLSLDKRYVFKRGEATPDLDEGCTVSEAIVALACAHPDSNLAVLAKSAIGRLEDRRNRFYPRLFSDKTTAHEVWQTVLLFRAVETKLNALRRASQGKRKAVATQGNRMITHMVLQKLKQTHDLREPIAQAEWRTLSSGIPGLTEQALDGLRAHIESEYNNNYVTSLFKNATKCAQIARAVSI